jgi:chromosome segregation ATPase
MKIVDRLDISLTKIENLEEQLEMERQKNKNLSTLFDSMKTDNGLVRKENRELELALDTSKEELERAKDKSTEELERANAELARANALLVLEQVLCRDLRTDLDKSKEDLERETNGSECVRCKRRRLCRDDGGAGTRPLFSEPEDDSSPPEDDSPPRQSPGPQRCPSYDHAEWQDAV